MRSPYNIDVLIDRCLRALDIDFNAERGESLHFPDRDNHCSTLEEKFRSMLTLFPSPQWRLSMMGLHKYLTTSPSEIQRGCGAKYRHSLARSCRKPPTVRVPWRRRAQRHLNCQPPKLCSIIHSIITSTFTVMSQTQETHTDTLEGSDTHNDGEKKQKNRRPASMLCFKQLRTTCIILTTPLNRHCISTTAPEGMAVRNLHDPCPSSKVDHHRADLFLLPKPSSHSSLP